MKPLILAAVLAALIAIAPASAGACTTHPLGYRPEPKATGKAIPVPRPGNGIAYGGVDPFHRVGRHSLPVWWRGARR